jgi:hypothetical protein
MSARTRRAAFTGALALLLANPAWAEDDAEVEQPDAAFLEYLGMWEGSDDEWILIDELVIADAEESPELSPEGEESTEADDES